VGLGVFCEQNQPVNLWTMPTLAGLGVSPGGFRAECRTVLGKTQAPRVEASQGNYYPGFIQPNKQKKKQKLTGCFASLDLCKTYTRLHPPAELG